MRFQRETVDVVKNCLGVDAEMYWPYGLGSMLFLYLRDLRGSPHGSYFGSLRRRLSVKHTNVSDAIEMKMRETERNSESFAG